MLPPDSGSRLGKYFSLTVVRTMSGSWSRIGSTVAQITDSGSHEDVGLRSARDQKSGHVVAIGPDRYHILRGGGFVVDVAGVDIGAVFKKDGCNFDVEAK